MVKSILLGATSSLTILSAAPSAFAAEDNDSKPSLVFANVQDVITVEGTYRQIENASATKTPTPIIDIPQSIVVLSRAQLDDQALIDIGDILRYTPGASIGQGEGHRDQITIRGQNTTADFFLDGLRDDVQYFRPLYNLERVEILKGPNALIFGRGGAGGVINRVTKSPDFAETFVGAEASVDTFGATYFSGDLNYSAGDIAAFRLNGFYESLDNHRDFFGGDRFAFNPTAAFQLTPATKIVASYEYVDDNRVVDRGVPSLNGQPLEGFDNTFFGDPDANLTELQAHISRLRIDHEISSNWKWDASALYADYDKLYQNIYPVGFDDIAGTVSLDGYRDTTERQNFIAQTNLIGQVQTGPASHTLLVGAEYGDQRSDNARRDVLFSDSSDDQITFLFSDPVNIPSFSFPVFNRNRNSDVEFFSAYIQDQIDLGPYFKIVGGVRFDRFTIDVEDQIEIANGSADGNDGFLRRTDEEFSPRAGIIFKPVENTSLYASYSRTFVPRSGDQFLTLTPSTEALGPEQFDNYEIGVKWDLLDQISLTAALFQLDRESGTTVDPNNPENTLLIGSRTRGFEAQLVGELLPGWSVNAGYSYLDADERGRVVSDMLANRTLGQVPEHMVSLWNRVEVTDRLSLGLGLTHQSSQFASISNAVALPSFTRVDVAAYYELSDNLQLQVNLENLTNTDYFPAAHNDNNITTGEPINARFTIRTRF